VESNVQVGTYLYCYSLINFLFKEAPGVSSSHPV
jgi:hypothetical protein